VQELVAQQESEGLFVSFRDFGLHQTGMEYHLQIRSSDHDIIREKTLEISAISANMIECIAASTTGTSSGRTMRNCSLLSWDTQDLPLTDLVTGTTFFVSVQVKNIYGISNESKTSVQLIGAPASPTGLDVILQTAQKWTLTWIQELARFWGDSQPVDHVVLIECGNTTMTIISNGSSLWNISTVYMDLKADWSDNGMKLSSGDADTFVVQSSPLMCVEGEDVRIKYKTPPRVMCVHR